MVDRKPELAANAARAGRAAAEDDLLDLLATWGASARDESADLLLAISRVRNVSDLLRDLQQRARDWLPPAQQDEVDQAVAILSAQGSLPARSFRARLAPVLARAGQALETREAQGAMEEKFEQARARLAALKERARQRVSASGDGLDAGAAGILARAVSGAERAIQASAESPDGWADFEPVLLAWQKTLESTIAADSISVEEQ